MIRKSRDIEACRSIHSVCMPYDAFPSGPHYWLAYVSGRPAGYASGEINKFGELFISGAAVLPEYRGQGIQRALTRAQMQWAKRNGAEWAMTYTMRDNPHSYNNYQKCGFHYYEPDFAFAGRRHVLYWRRKL